MTSEIGKAPTSRPCRIRHDAGHESVQVVHLIELGEVIAEVGCPLEAGAVEEELVLVLLRGLHGVVHESEAGGEDDVAFLLVHEAVDDADRIAFRNAFHDHGFEPGELAHDVLPSDLVGVGPSEVADGTDVDEPGLDLLGRLGGRRRLALFSFGGTLSAA
jgi:hypothetical protein